MVKSKSTQHEMATSDFNKSKTNKSTYKSFHRQTGTYPYIAQKKLRQIRQLNPCQKNIQNCIIFQKFNYLACSPVHTGMRQIVWEIASTLIFI